MPLPTTHDLRRRVRVGRTCRMPGLSLFGHYEYLAAQSVLAGHRHQGSIEICFLVRGEQTYRVGRKIYRLRGGDQFVTFPDEWHDTADEPEQKGALYWIILQLNPLPENFLFLPSRLARALARDLNRLPARHFRAAPDAGAWLAKCAAALERSPSGRSQLEAASALHQYLLATLQAGTRAGNLSPGARVRQAIDWLAAHLHEPVRVREMAESAGWSEAHFKAAFRRETGGTPHDYFLRLKIARARDWLAHEKQSVTEVALALGFSSSQHFATAFRKFTGRSPSAFARQADVISRSQRDARG